MKLPLSDHLSAAWAAGATARATINPAVLTAVVTIPRIRASSSAHLDRHSLSPLGHVQRRNMAEQH